MSSIVSVVIPTYNCGRFLSGTLDSVLGQTFTDWEAIVVDDGSTDNTSQIVEPYLRDTRVHYHCIDHLGASAARNAGIRLTTAPYVAFLDADDLWLPTKLERQVALFRDDPELGVAYTRRLLMDEDGHLLESWQPEFHRGYVVQQMFQVNFVCTSTSMVRRDVLDDVGLFAEGLELSEDWDFWLRAARHYRFDYVDEPLAMYRAGHASLSRHVEKRLHIVLRIRRRFVNEYGGRKLLEPSVVRHAYARTKANIGQATRGRSRWAALPWYLRSLATHPGHIPAWKGLAVLLLPETGRRLARRALGRPTDWGVLPKRLEDAAGVATGLTNAEAPTQADVQAES